ncbi:hypothetical protein [Candidatus Poriferisodalis sp.]|uniref:hypothetical protein n=1 Tax=Candidatus Poriferisodalis sp. TaxID=3101277 RepID=UPI003B52D45B
MAKDRQAGREALEGLDKTVTEILDVTDGSEDEFVTALTGADEPSPSGNLAADRGDAVGT